MSITEAMVRVPGDVVAGAVEADAVEAKPIPSRYESAVQVGAGGMGIVYRVRDRETGDVVALKVLRADVAADPSMQENLMREVRLARKVTHKNVCRIHEFSRAEGRAYISMEFVEGKSLQASLQENGRLPWNEVVKIAKQICAGLGEAHAQGIVHRDLKPANIMIDASGVAKIMDFGIARPAQVTVKMTSTMIGTPAYMAPEQVAGRGVDARTDIYAVGLLLYAMVTSSEAFEGNAPLAVALKQLREFPTPAREVVPGLPAHAEAIIVKCIQKDPAKRFQSMDELAAALTEAPVATATTPAMLKTQPMEKTQALEMAPVVVRTAAPEKVQARNIGLEVEKFAGEAYRSALLSVKDVRRSLSESNWKILQSKKKQRLLAAGLAGACLVGGIVFAVPRMSGRNSAARVGALAGAAPVSVQETKAAALVPVDVKSSAVDISGKDAELAAGNSVASNSASAVDAHKLKAEARKERESEKNSSTNAGAVTRTGSANLKGSVAHSGKSQMMAGDGAAPLVAANVPLAAVVTPTSSADATVAVPDVTATNGHESGKQKIGKTISGIGTVVRSIVPKGAPAEAGFQAKTGSENAALAEGYLEVGVFKDSKPADEMAEKLSKLGFHATSLHKTVLWKQSYQVRVGPYTDLAELNTAQQEIVSAGFNARVVK
jgi:serine/threonine protein kinase